MIEVQNPNGWTEIHGTREGWCVFCSEPVQVGYGFIREVPVGEPIRVTIRMCTSHYGRNVKMVRRLAKQKLQEKLDDRDKVKR